MASPSEYSAVHNDRFLARTQHVMHEQLSEPETHQSVVYDFEGIGGQFANRRSSYPHQIEFSEGEDAVRKSRSPSDVEAFLDASASTAPPLTLSSPPTTPVPDRYQDARAMHPSDVQLAREAIRRGRMRHTRSSENTSNGTDIGSHDPRDIALYFPTDNGPSKQVPDSDSDELSESTIARSICAIGESHISAFSARFLLIGETEDSFSEKLENLIWQHPSVQELMVGALNERDIDCDQLERKIRRLLEQMGSDLAREASSSEQRHVAGFVAAISRSVAAALRRRADDAHVHRPLSNSERLSGMRLLESTDRHKSPTLYKSSSEDDTDPKDTQGAAKNEHSDLDRFKSFIVSSQAFSALRIELQSFVDREARLTLRALLLKSAERATGGDLCNDDYRWIVTLASELGGTDPLSINVVTTETVGLIDQLKRGVERWTGGKWEWWPLRPPGNPKGKAVQWTCVCGESRFLECPPFFVTSAVQLRNYVYKATSSGTGQRSGISSTAVPISLPQNAQQTRQSGSGSGSGSRTVPISVPSMPQPRASVTIGNATNLTPLLISKWVLLVVQASGGLKVAHLRMQGLNNNSFFVNLRSEYFCLRGRSRRYFSVWGFAYCDFYKFEKFDEHAVASREQNQYPDDQNQDYDFKPRPVIDMPPITRHEFKKRFYSCTPSLLHFHCYKDCECSKLRKKAHNREVIDILPKKLTRLDVENDRKEQFWGLYARQEIHFFRVLVYNTMCISPLIWFFFMWLFSWGHGGDLQSASAPMMVMMALLSMFWVVFVVSIKQGNEADV